MGSDPDLKVKEVINLYFEKDFIEQIFRTLKSDEEIEPVRHKVESRVIAYMFLNVLAYRLIAALEYKLENISNKTNSWERAYYLLRGLGKIERTSFKLRYQYKICYLNMNKDLQEMLKKLRYENLFEEQGGVDFRL
ncbi:MAG: hypothetical protein QXZ12_08305 [Thermoplasmata archaeon]